MHCIKCHSPRIIKFIDGMGEPRVFCRTCQESILVQDILVSQKTLPEFNYYKRWDNGKIRIPASNIIKR